MLMRFFDSSSLHGQCSRYHVYFHPMTQLAVSFIDQDFSPFFTVLFDTKNMRFALGIAITLFVNILLFLRINFYPILLRCLSVLCASTAYTPYRTPSFPSSMPSHLLIAGYRIPQDSALSRISWCIKIKIIALNTAKLIFVNSFLFYRINFYPIWLEWSIGVFATIVSVLQAECPPFPSFPWQAIFISI